MAVSAPSTSAYVGAVAPSPQKMPQSCPANACLLTEEEDQLVMPVLKKQASLVWLPNTGFQCDVSLICLLKHLVAA